MSYDVLFDGTSRGTWGRYLEESNRKNAQTFQSRPAPQILRQDDRGRPAKAVDILAVLRQVGRPIHQTEIMQRTGGSRERVSLELQRLITAWLVTRTARAGGPALYTVVR